MHAKQTQWIENIVSFELELISGHRRIGSFSAVNRMSCLEWVAFYLRQKWKQCFGCSRNWNDILSLKKRLSLMYKRGTNAVDVRAVITYNDWPWNESRCLCVCVCSQSVAIYSCRNKHYFIFQFLFRNWLFLINDCFELRFFIISCYVAYCEVIWIDIQTIGINFKAIIKCTDTISTTSFFFIIIQRMWYLFVFYDVDYLSMEGN